MAGLAATLLALAACGGGGEAPRPAQPAPPPLEWREGDLSIRATTLPTMQLSEGIARSYGIARRDGGIMLLVAVRRGPEGGEAAVPARVSATATDLAGRRRDIPMRELRTGDLVDHVGTLDVDAPDTLQFRVEVAPEGASARVLDFGREFFP